MPTGDPRPVVAPELPRVAVILTGGTIDSLGIDRLDVAWYFEANCRLGSGELLARVRELNDLARIEEVAFRRLPSHALQSASNMGFDWVSIGQHWMSYPAIWPQPIPFLARIAPVTGSIERGRLGFTPYQKPHPPIEMGAQSDGAARRAARLGLRLRTVWRRCYGRSPKLD